MALTAAQTYALFEILDVPYSDGTNSTGSYNVVDGMGSLASATTLSGSTQSIAITAINTWLAAMVAATNAALATLLDSYIALGTSDAELNGMVGSIGPIHYSIAGERKELTRRVRILCPFYPFNEVDKRRQGLQDTGVGSGLMVVAG